MIVRFFATMRGVAGTANHEVQGCPTTLDELFDELATSFGPEFAGKVRPNGRLDDALMVLVNGRNVRFSGGLATALGPDDEIAVFPPVGGG